MIVRRLVFGFIVLAGLSATLVCGYFVLADWGALDKAYGEYQRQIQQGADMRSLFISESVQNVHRINCFADGVGFLLGAILSAIGFLGWYQVPARQR